MGRGLEAPLSVKYIISFPSSSALPLIDWQTWLYLEGTHEIGAHLSGDHSNVSPGASSCTGDSRLRTSKAATYSGFLEPMCSPLFVAWELGEPLPWIIWRLFHKSIISFVIYGPESTCETRPRWWRLVVSAHDSSSWEDRHIDRTQFGITIEGYFYRTYQHWTDTNVNHTRSACSILGLFGLYCLRHFCASSFFLESVLLPLP